MKRHPLLAFVLCLALLWAACPARAASPDSQTPKEPPAVASSPLERIPLEARLKIEPSVLKALLPGSIETKGAAARPGQTTFLVYMRERAPIRELARMGGDRASQRRALVASLRDTASRSQADLTLFLDRQKASKKVGRYQSYWIFNGLAVEADLDTLVQIALRPDVEMVRANHVHRLPEPQSVPSASADSATPAWNITRIGANSVWEALGVTGEGVVVANMDSGVDWTHPALQHKYRGYNANDPDSSTHDYNWFDPTGTYPSAPGPNEPYAGSNSDHGTHTMGTIVGSEADGSNPIGVAPGAQWVAVKVFDDDGYTTDEWLHAGYQWCLAPTDLQGNNPDPSLAPDIVSNSWGDDNGSDQTFSQDVAAWNAAGIFSAWAAGNAGPDAATVGSPASFAHAFAVGATDSNDAIASFSSRGPSPWGEIKPEVVAPGVNVRSAIPGGSYESSWSGTSMATPHVAGLAALMWQAASHSLSITATAFVITSTAIELGPTGEDNAFGYGLIDAYQAVGSVMRGGAFAGRVTAAASGAPISGATIHMVNLDTGGQASTQTLADGSYRFAVAEGRYNVTASYYGYEDSIAAGVEILSQTLTQLDFSLVRLPSGVIQGRVTRASDGQAVAATVALLGTPLQATVDRSGYYTLEAPVGVYTLRTLPNGAGYRGSEIENIQVTQDATVTQNVALATAPSILLVDADASVDSNALPYYQTALAGALYGHDTRRILDEYTDIPTADVLSNYDIVIWSQPTRSPGYIGAWDELGAYLDQGGRLLISGQDIGFLDYYSDAYRQYLHATFVSDDSGLGALSGVPGDILDGLTLAYNTSDSARNQETPDSVAAYDAYAAPIINAATGEIVGLRGDNCTFRSVYLSFGLEGVGSAAARQEALTRMITWLGGARPAQGVTINMPLVTQAGSIGATVMYDASVCNIGGGSDRFSLTVTSPTWSARLVDATTGQVITQTDSLAPCDIARLRLEVEIPESAAMNQTELATIRAVSRSAPSISAERSVQTTALRDWVRGESLPTARYRMACAATDCRIYAIGGYDSDDMATNRVEIFDLTTGTWSSGANKPTVSANSAAAALNGRIYVLGGYDPDSYDEYYDVVEVYDPADDDWTTAAHLPQALSSAAATSYDGKIYLFGGSTSNDLSNQSYVYDPALDEWSEIEPLPTDGLAVASAVTLGDYLYVAGGWSNRTEFYRYDPAEDTWTTLAPMSVGRNGLALAAIGDYIFAAGGGDGWYGLDAAERYDPIANQWVTLLPLSDGNRSGAGGVAVDGRFYVIGGTSSDDETTTASVEYLDIASPFSGSSFAVSSTTAQPGDSLGYVLRLNNPAATTVTASWSHVVPDEMDFVAGSNTGGSVYDAATRTLHWSGEIAAATQRMFDFQAIIRDSVANNSLITSTVSVDGGGCGVGQMSAVTRILMPSLEFSTKTVDKSRVAPGGALRYTVNIANGTPYTITNATLTDPIPANTTYVSGSATGGATYNAAQRRIEWAGVVPPAATETPSFGWRDATSGEKLDLWDDSCVGPLSLGFSFEFYGNTYSQIYVNSNGMVLFDECSSSLGNTSIPSADSPNGFVAPLWDDLVPNNGGGVYYKTFGAAPNRYAVIEWYQVPCYNTDEQQTFEALLYEGSNRVVFQYSDMSGERGAGNSATVGAENHDGSAGVQYLLNGAPIGHRLYDGLAIEIEHSSTKNASIRQISYDVVVDNPAPPFTIITNTATIYDGRATHQRVVTTAVDSPSFGSSTKQAQPQSALSGQVVTFTLRLINSGTAAATGAHLVDALPVGLSFVPGSLIGSGATYDAANRAINWSGAIPVDPEGLRISYRALIDDGLPHNTWLTNTATLTDHGATVATLRAAIVANEINLTSSTKEVSAASVGAGGVLTYTITVRNSGLVAANQARMTDPLPAALELVEGSLDGGVYDSGSHSIVWEGSLPPTAEHVVRFAANVDDRTVNGTSLLNTAVLEDGWGATHEITAVTTVLRGDLSASQLLLEPNSVAPGGAVTCTLRLRNTGAYQMDGALTLPIPTPFVVDTATIYASSGAVSYEDGAIHWSGSVLSQAMALVRLTMTVPVGTPEQSLYLEGSVIDEGGIETTLRKLVRISDMPYAIYLPLSRR